MSAVNPLNENETAFVLTQRVARLATADAEGNPFVVPICYAFDGKRFYTPLDEKPKLVADNELRRVRNIEARSDVSLVIDRYDDDWTQLGYVLVRGRAEILPPATTIHATALAHLRERYAQYRTMPLEHRPIIAIIPLSVTSWGPALTSAVAGSAAPPTWTQSGRGMDFLPLAQGRRSVRAFQADRDVPREALETMLEAARWAPSPHGRQPWRFVVLTRPEPKLRLSEAMGDEWQRTLAMDGQEPEIIELRLGKSRERIRTAPALILACLYLADLDQYPDEERQHNEEVMAIQSLGAAIQNILLSAYAQGLDCGWMCAPLFSPDAVRAALNLDAMLIPHALIPVGYAARDPKRRPHRPISDLVVKFE